MKETITVRAFIEYEVDVSDLDEKFVDIDGFAQEEARRMLNNNLCEVNFTADDFSTIITGRKTEI